jgi:myo-inositol-1(or 4)-monophosphatase
MINAARKAARAVSRDFGEVENLQVSQKAPADFVTRADRKAEEVIRDELKKARPQWGFLLEESGEIPGKDGQHVWVVDPIDGTTNFIHGIPALCHVHRTDAQWRAGGGCGVQPDQR